MGKSKIAWCSHTENYQAGCTKVSRIADVRDVEHEGRTEEAERLRKAAADAVLMGGAR